MVTLPTAGQANWDVPLNAALTDMDQGAFDPVDVSWVAWNYDPLLITTLTDGTAPASGTVRMVRLPRLPQPTTITNILFSTGGGSGHVSGQNFAGLYDSTGNQVGVSGDITAEFGTAGLKTIPLTTPFSAAAETYYVAILQNAVTTGQLGLASRATNSIANAGLSMAEARFTDGPTGQTSLPATITMSTRTPVVFTTWAAVS